MSEVGGWWLVVESVLPTAGVLALLCKEGGCAPAVDNTLAETGLVRFRLGVGERKRREEEEGKSRGFVDITVYMYSI